jgi:putative membrane protein
MRKTLSIFIFVPMLFFGAAVHAASDKSGTGKLSKEDETFLKEAAQGGQMEVELGNVAAKKASNDRVKAFGKRMTEDHGKANKELAALAKKKNVQISKTLDDKHKNEVDRLSKLSGLSGSEFDREYMEAMVKDHKEDVEKFERAAKEAKDSDIKQFASKTLPVLKDHLELAQTTHQQLGNAGNVAKNK